jgi:hypothetical protein
VNAASIHVGPAGTRVLGCHARAAITASAHDEAQQMAHRAAGAGRVLHGDCDQHGIPTVVRRHPYASRPPQNGFHLRHNVIGQHGMPVHIVVMRAAFERGVGVDNDPVGYLRAHACRDTQGGSLLSLICNGQGPEDVNLVEAAKDHGASASGEFSRGRLLRVLHCSPNRM